MSKFLRNATLLGSSNLAARIITVALMPIITRIYSPEIFGIFAVCLSLIGVLAAISCFRYFVAIIIAETLNEAATLTLLSLFILLVFSGGVGLLLWLFSTNVVATFDLFGYEYILLFIPLLVFLAGAVQIFTNWILRQNLYMGIASSRVLDAMTNRGVTIILGLIGGGVSPVGLILGKAIGQIVAVATMLYFSLREQWKFLAKGYDIPCMIRLGKKYLDLPKYSASALLQATNTQLPVLLIGYYFSPVIVGLFILGKRVVADPLQTIGEALASSFLQKNAEDIREGREIGEFSFAVFNYTISLVMPPLFVFVLVAPELIPVVFGMQWVDAGIYLQYMFPVLVGTFLIRPISNIFDLTGNQKARLLFAGLSSVTIFVSFFIGSALDDPLLGVGVYSIFEFLTVVVRVLWLLKIVGVGHCRVIRTLCVKGAITFAIGTPLLLMKEVFQPSFAFEMTTAILIISSYFVSFVFFDVKLRKKFVNAFLKK